jgi:hypothetical protein
VSHAAVIWAVLSLLVFVVALFVATVTGFLVWLDRRKLIGAILHAGVAFAGTLTLGAVLAGTGAAIWSAALGR